MSYCRWSSDGFLSDVYCYADIFGGYTTHVADNRLIKDQAYPPPVDFNRDHPEEWMEWNQRLTSWLKSAKREPLGLAHDGESFNDPTPGEAADRLEMLRAAGYHVPQSAIDRLRAEALELADQGGDDA